MSLKTYLITGANRGIGLGLTTSLLARSNVLVIAAVRDLSSSSSKALSSLPTGPSSKLIVVKVDAASPTDAHDAAATLQMQHCISELDVVIANAGISKYYGPATTTPLSEVRDHYEVNVMGPLAIFQATWPLLQKSEAPIFVAVSTGAASIGDMGDIPFPLTAYGASKAALNFIVRKIHFENEKLIAFPISPGIVQTDMGNLGAQTMGAAEAPVTVKDSVDGILNKIDNATRETTSGTFQSFDATEYKW